MTCDNYEYNTYVGNMKWSTRNMIVSTITIQGQTYTQLLDESIETLLYIQFFDWIGSADYADDLKTLYLCFACHSFNNFMYDLHWKPDSKRQTNDTWQSVG